jgi:hypothetical protein
MGGNWPPSSGRKRRMVRAGLATHPGCGGIVSRSSGAKTAICSYCRVRFTIAEWAAMGVLPYGYRPRRLRYNAPWRSRCPNFLIKAGLKSDGETQ